MSMASFPNNTGSATGAPMTYNNGSGFLGSLQAIGSVVGAGFEQVSSFLERKEAIKLAQAQARADLVTPEQTPSFNFGQNTRETALIAGGIVALGVGVWYLLK